MEPKTGETFGSFAFLSYLCKQDKSNKHQYRKILSDNVDEVRSTQKKCPHKGTFFLPPLFHLSPDVLEPDVFGTEAPFFLSFIVEGEAFCIRFTCCMRPICKITLLAVHHAISVVHGDHDAFRPDVCPFFHNTASFLPLWM